MTIPTLSNTKFGYDWLDGQPGKLPFSANGVVIGKGGKVFTLADTVGFGLKTRFVIPLMIEADKVICLDGSGDAIDGTAICTTFGEAAILSPDITRFTRPTDGKQYVIIGKGDYQYQNTVGGDYSKVSSTSADSINLFKGSSLYTTSAGGRVTLNSSFQ